MPFETVIGGLGKLSEQLRTTAVVASETSTAVRQASAEIVEAATAGQDRLARLKADAEAQRSGAFSILDELRAQAEAADNEFSALIVNLIDRIKVGAASIQDLTQQWGSSYVTINGDLTTLQQALNAAGVDVTGFRQELAQLAADISSGKAAAADVSAFLDRQGGQFADALKAIIDGFSQGQTSLQGLLGLLKNFEATLGGGEEGLSAIVAALSQQAQAGRL